MDPVMPEAAVPPPAFSPGPAHSPPRLPPGAVQLPSPVVAPPPAHATREDPAVLAVALVEQAAARAGRKALGEIEHALPALLDRLAVRRFGVAVAAGAAGLLTAGLLAGCLLGWLTAGQGMVCDTVSSPGWKHCWKWVGTTR